MAWSSPVAEFYGQFLSDGFAEGGLAGPWWPMKEDCPVEGDKVWINALLAKMQGCTGILEKLLLDALPKLTSSQV